MPISKKKAPFKIKDALTTNESNIFWTNKTMNNSMQDKGWFKCFDQLIKIEFH
jgi:hypothetical protein